MPMQSRLLPMFLAVSLAMAHATPAPAAAPHLGQVLEQADLLYEREASGLFKVLYRFDDQRSQLVFLRPGQDAAGIDTVEIYTPVLRLGDRRVSQALGDRLMLENGRRLLGYFGVEEVEGVRFLFCYHNLPTEGLDPAVLSKVLEIVAVAADEMEKEQLGADSDEF